MDHHRPDDVPPMRLESLHHSLRGHWGNVPGGVTLLLLVALAAVLALVVWETPDSNEAGSNRKHHSSSQTARSAERYQHRLSPHELELQRLKVELDARKEKQQQEQAVVAARKKVGLGPVPSGHVRVAAVQVHSFFGKPKKNRKRLLPFIERAAKEGARIIVLPEGAVSGYADMQQEIFWSSAKPTSEDYRDARPVAERRSGTSVRFFSKVAKRLGVYLTVPLIEKDGDALHSTTILLGHTGRVESYYRKRQIWEPADGKWITPGTAPTPVIDTPYGRLALTTSYDISKTFSELKTTNAEILLWSAALYGENYRARFNSNGFLESIRAAGVDVILANWTYWPAPWWEGHGHSRIIGADGKTRAASNDKNREMLVIHDLPLRKRVLAK